MKCYTKGGVIPAPRMPKQSVTKVPRPEAQPTNVNRKIPDVSAEPFLGPSITSRPKPRRM